MDRLRLLFKIAFVFSGATFVLAVVCLAGFILRWCGVSTLAVLSSNAGYVGYGALATLVGCFIAMYKAAELSQELQAQREAAAKLAEASSAAGTDPQA